MLDNIQLFRKYRFVHRIRQETEQRPFYSVLQFLELLSDPDIVDGYLLVLTPRADRAQPSDDVKQSTYYS